MKRWTSLSALALLALAGFLYLSPDLRGWAPSDLDDPAARVFPTSKGGREFSLDQCLPGSMKSHELADSGDGAGTATMVVLTCRSRSSTIPFGLAWLLLSASLPLSAAFRTRYREAAGGRRRLPH